MRRDPLAALCLAALIGVAAGVRAEPSRVAIVRPLRPAASAQATARLVAEIRAAGFEPVVIDAVPGVSPRDQVEGGPAALEPFATIAILATDRGVVADVWVADHLSHKTVVRRVDTSAAASDEAPRLLAIRAVELLRASLLELEHGPGADRARLPEDVSRWMHRDDVPAVPVAPASPAPPASSAAVPARGAPAPPADGPAPSAAPALSRRARHAFAAHPAVELGGAWLFDTGGLRAPALAPRVSAPLDEAWFIRLSLTESAAQPRLDSAAGTVRFGQELALAELGLAAWNRSGRWLPIVALGLGLFHMRAEGQAVPPFESLQADGWAFAVSASVGVAVRLSDSFALVGDLAAVAITPRFSLQILENTPAGTGAALVRPGVGVWACL